MLTELEAPPDPTQFWSWKKILAWFPGILTVSSAILLSYDERLRPHEELLSHRRDLPDDSAQNGWTFLVNTWQTYLKPDPKARQKWTNILQGREPWSDAVVDLFYVAAAESETFMEKMPHGDPYPADSDMRRRLWRLFTKKNLTCNLMNRFPRIHGTVSPCSGTLPGRFFMQ